MLKLSASSIGTYQKCPKQYHYRYIEKPDVIKKKWVFSEFGSCAHKALELFHLDLMSNVRSPDIFGDIMTECFIAALQEYDQKLLEPEMNSLYEVIQNYLFKIKKEGITQVIAVEKEFSLTINGHIVRGYIDRIDKVNDNTYHVVDYKTSKSPSYLTNFQLLVYALAVKELYPDAENISGSYCLLKHKSDMMSWDFSDDDLKETVEKIKSIERDIELEIKWVKKPSKLCDFCDYKDICQGSSDSWV